MALQLAGGTTDLRIWFRSTSLYQALDTVRHSSLVYSLLCGPKLGKYLVQSRKVVGWAAQNESIALGKACYNLPSNPVIVEIGTFLGRSAVIMAGACKEKGSGTVHIMDPFDCSGDVISMPIYKDMAAKRPNLTLRQWFDENMEQAGVTDWIKVYEGFAEDFAPNWTAPIDLLLLSGDQSVKGARLAYETYIPFLKPGGILVVHNSNDRIYAPDHDGNRRLVLETIREPEYTDIQCIDCSTFARKV